MSGDKKQAISEKYLRKSSRNITRPAATIVSPASPHRDYECPDIFKLVKCSHSLAMQVVFARVRETSRAHRMFQKGAKSSYEKTFPPLLLWASGAAAAPAQGGQQQERSQSTRERCDGGKEGSSFSFNVLVNPWNCNGGLMMATQPCCRGCLPRSAVRTGHLPLGPRLPTTCKQMQSIKPL